MCAVVRFFAIVVVQLHLTIRREVKVLSFVYNAINSYGILEVFTVHICVGEKVNDKRQ